MGSKKHLYFLSQTFSVLCTFDKANIKVNLFLRVYWQSSLVGLSVSHIL